MITAIDFGCYAIRSGCRRSGRGTSLVVCSERSEYVVLPAVERYRQLLKDDCLVHAECEEFLTVYGNHARRARWLSRMPAARIFSDGMVPQDDPPARQMLDLISTGVLPPPSSGENLCAFTIPGAEGRDVSCRFLSQLIRMRGYEPFPVSAAEAAMLAEGSETSFSGISVVIGAETTELCVCRLGVSLASMRLPVGADWIDIELARQFDIQVFDEDGRAWLDLEAVREWKHQPERSLREPAGERDTVLARLYRAVLTQTAQSVRQLLSGPRVRSVLGEDRLEVVCAGGATRISGFASCLTECLVDQNVAGQVRSVRTVDRPELAVIRGALISAELESRSRRDCRRHAA